MARNAHHEFLSSLLDSPEGRERIQDIWEEITTKRSQRVDSINCPRCGEEKKVDVVVEVYSIKDAMEFLKWAATFGIGKPPEKHEHRMTHDYSHDLAGLSIEELRAIAAGTEYQELPA
jgi:hypothetical protein